MGFCTIDGVFDKSPQFEEGTFDDLFQYLKTHTRAVPHSMDELQRMGDEELRMVKNGPAVILAQFKRPGVRVDGEVLVTTGLGLDVDERHIPLEGLVEVLTGTSAIVYESLRSTSEARRWRVFIEYLHPMTPEEHARAFEYWQRRIGPAVGVASRNPSRLWFTVSQCRDAPRRVLRRLKGEPYQVGRVPTEGGRKRVSVMDVLPPPVGEPAAEGGRNNALAAYALSVLKDHATEVDFLGALYALNATYMPPLEDREVIALARSTWAKRQKFGWVEPVLRKDPTDDGMLGDDLADLFMREAGEVPWLVQDMVTHGAHLLVGRPKGGKSWLTMDLAYAVAAGATFVGQQARRGGVLWIASEDTRDGLTRRLKVRGEMPPTGQVITMTMERLRAERARWTEVSFRDWLNGFLEEHPDIELVILDTQKTCEAIWAGEDIEVKTRASVVDIAYQDVRRYDQLGQDTKTCIVLVHHAGKMKNNKEADYHEMINLPATAVAGATASFVLADLPEADRHDEDNQMRIFAPRGRHIIKGVPLQVLFDHGRVVLQGVYVEIKQTEAQQETLAMLEELLRENGWPTQHEVWVTQKQIAAALGKQQSTIQRSFKAMKQDPAKMVWKQYRVVLKQQRGITLVQR
jgi:hypothetical protein